MTKNASALAGSAAARDLIAAPVTARARGQLQLRWSQLLRLCKPRVVSLIVFTAVIGMFLAVPGLPPAGPLLFGSLGIALVASAAAAVNCLIEREIDAKMARTRSRPLPTGSTTPLQTLILASVLGGAGLLCLYFKANPLTMWLTLATFLGYAVVYTVLLKPLTPQNIVIGGLSGAMPPVLGWATVTGAVSSNALLLLLIIFAWTPPHFWALALYRKHEYAKAGIPMLPVTHGDRFTRLHVLLYTIILAAVSLMPFASGMSGYFYLVSVLALDGVFLYFAIRLYTDFSTSLAARTFRYSILYLSCLFAALLLDHYLL
jgi:heme o synthase